MSHKMSLGGGAGGENPAVGAKNIAPPQKKIAR